MTVKKLDNDMLIDLFSNNGIVQEVNRTFFHPLGIELKINSEEKKLEYYYTEEDKGFLLEVISDFQSKLFSAYRNERHEKRGEALGFLIQINDLYRTKNIGDSLPIPPSTKKFNKIINCFNSFAHGIYKVFAIHHKEHDENLDPNQFNKESLLTRIEANIRQGEYEDAAALLCLLRNLEILKKYMEELQLYEPIYKKRVQQFNRKIKKGEK